MTDRLCFVLVTILTAICREGHGMRPFSLRFTPYVLIAVAFPQDRNFVRIIRREITVENIMHP